MLCVHCRCNPVFQYSTTLMVVVVLLLKSLSGIECAIVLPALIITAVNKYIYVNKKKTNPDLFIHVLSAPRPGGVVVHPPRSQT